MVGPNKLEKKSCLVMDSPFNLKYLPLNQSRTKFDYKIHHLKPERNLKILHSYFCNHYL